MSELTTQLPDATDLLDRLDEAQQQRLAELFEQARSDQQQRLKQAVDDILGFVPRLLRGPIKKILS